MKQTFIKFYYAPKQGQGTPKATPAENGETPATPSGDGKGATEPEVLASEKLTELQAKKAANRTALRQAEDDKTADALLLEGYKISNEIKAEEANIRKSQNDAKIAEARNARVAMLNELISMVLADNGVTTPATPSDATIAQHDKVSTELLAKFAGSTASKTANSPKEGGSRGATGETIKAALIAKLAGGGTVTDALKAIIEENNFSRGTAGAVRTAMRKAGELAQYGENPE